MNRAWAISRDGADFLAENNATMDHRQLAEHQPTLWPVAPLLGVESKARCQSDIWEQ